MEEVRSLLANGWLSPSDLGQYEGESQWQPLSSISELKLEAEPETQTPPEPASAPVMEEVPAQSSRRPRVKIQIPWRPILKGIVLVAVIGGLGYGAMLGLQKLKSDPPQFLTKIRQSIKRQEKPVPVDGSQTNRSAAVSSISNQPQTSAKTEPVSVAPTAASAVSMTNHAQAVALIDAGVIQESRLTGDSASTSRSVSPQSTKAESRRRTIATADLDPKMTPFGSYDVAMIQSIQKRWIEILNEQNVAQGRTGRVIIEFRLSYQGRASDLRTAETTSEEVLAYLCEKAIRESEPFNPWPAELRKLVKGDHRLMRFTFYY